MKRKVISGFMMDGYIGFANSICKHCNNFDLKYYYTLCLTIIMKMGDKLNGNNSNNNNDINNINNNNKNNNNSKSNSKGIGLNNITFICRCYPHMIKSIVWKYKNNKNTKKLAKSFMKYILSC